MFALAQLILFALLALAVLVRYVWIVTNPEEEREELERLKDGGSDFTPDKPD